MNRLQSLFNSKKSGVLNVYCTAGYPALDSTPRILKALQDAGADLVEIGMPYSDPLADGPVIQESSSIALQNGMSMALLFSQLKNIRKDIQVPLILMGYMNPVLQYGFERFCADAAAVGIDGLILPDLPMYEFETLYQPIIRKYGLDFIFLVTPETSDDRLRQIDTLSTGFLYAVSSSSTTGSNKQLTGSDAYFEKLKNFGLKNPVLIGFGIHDKSSFDHAAAYANGAIIGSAYIRSLHGQNDVEKVTRDFVNKIRGLN